MDRMANSGTLALFHPLCAFGLKRDALVDGVDGCYYHARAVYYRIE